ncbi:MAG: hypothetical protein ABIQ93_09485 [Saprospiraceae bacterium]
MNPAPDFQLFNALWNMIICSIAGFLLYQVWKVIVVKKDKPEDKGGFYLAGSLIFWVSTGLLDLVDWWKPEPGNPHWPLIYNLLRCWLSTWNSVFILFAIHYFDLVPRWFVDVVRHPDWKKWVRGIGLLVSVLSAFEAFRLWWGGKNYYGAIYTWDFFFSTLTGSLLLILIVHILRREDFRRLVWIGGFLILLIMIAQFLDWRPEWFGGTEGAHPWSEFWNFFFHNIYKTLLLIVFAVILLSWALRAPAVEKAILPTLAEICQQYGITPRDVEMLRRLAKGETREAITPVIFPGKTGREAVDERQKDLAAKFNVPNNLVAVLMFALKNHMVALGDL